MATANTSNIQLVHRRFSSEKCVDPQTLPTFSMSMHFFMEFVNKAIGLRLYIPKRKAKMNVWSIWPFALMSGDSYYLSTWQCARYFVAALFKELSLITIREMWGLESRSRISRSRCRFLWQVSVSSRNLSQVSVSEVTVPTTSLPWSLDSGHLLH